MRKQEKRIVGLIGEIFLDEIFTGFHTLPKLGEESFARKFQREVGGGAAITACGLARLGVHVRLFGLAGKSDSAWLVHRLKTLGVDCSGLQFYDDEPTGITVSVSTREDRAFFTYYGANLHLEEFLRLPNTGDGLSRCQHVHFACAPDETENGQLFRHLRIASTISVDVQSHVSWLTRPESLKILRRCDMFFPNETEGGWIAGASSPHDILLRLRDKGVRGVGLKLGGKGAALLWKRRQFLAAPFPVETVDTTGAGDCFNAGFIYAWLRGDSPQRCLEVANICGALSTRALGGVDGFPTLEELSEYESNLEKEK